MNASTRLWSEIAVALAYYDMATIGTVRSFIVHAPTTPRTEMADALAYYDMGIIGTVKSFIAHAPTRLWTEMADALAYYDMATVLCACLNKALDGNEKRCSFL